MNETYADLGGQPSTMKPPKLKPKAHPPQGINCEHTDDPHGFLMDADGRLVGRCPCWFEPETTDETQGK